MILKGNPVSPGVVVGNAYIYKAFTCDVLEAYFEKGHEAKYIEIFNAAFAEAHRELDQLIASFAAEDADKAKIFTAQKEILDDEEILDMIHDAIATEQKRPDFAVNNAYDEFIRILGKTKDPLIAARTLDLRDVRNRLLRVLQGEKEKNLSYLPESVIVVAHDLLPSDTATLDRAHVAGIITEAGSSTSHTAIIARSYKIPAVLGVQQATDVIGEGTLLALDAICGEITVAPGQKVLEQSQKKADAFKKQQELAEKYLDKPVVTADGQHIDIGVNIGSDNFDIASENYDFVGLFRTEFLYMKSDHLPTEEEQFEAYKRVLKNSGGKTVTLRTLDIGGDKTLQYMQLPKEDNPFLGKRALRLCLDNPDIFSTQLRAALRASAFGSLQIMFPMVGSIDDIRRAKAALSDAKVQLRAEGKAFNEDIKLGIMIEIPSIAAIADIAAEEVDFASVGTNDLTQYLCAVDRMNPDIAGYYQGLCPAMLRLLGFIFEQFNAKGKPVSVCGELAGDPAAAVVMIGLGLHKLSMSEANLARVKAALADITMDKARALGATCKNLATETEVKAYLQENLF
jgi:phosphotransferase system enzyme I (PtsI)